MNDVGKIGAIGEGYARGYVTSLQPPAMLAEQQVKQAEIPHQLERLERTLNGCVQGLCTRGEKLESSVMRSPMPDKTAASEPVPTTVTALGSRLQAQVNTAALINDQIQSLIFRLEV